MIQKSIERTVHVDNLWKIICKTVPIMGSLDLVGILAAQSGIPIIGPDILVRHQASFIYWNNLISTSCIIAYLLAFVWLIGASFDRS